MRIRVGIGAAALAAAATVTAATLAAPVQADPTAATTLEPFAPGRAAIGRSDDVVELPTSDRAAKRLDLRTPAEAVGLDARLLSPSTSPAQDYRGLRRGAIPVTYDLNFVQIPLTGLPGGRGFSQADAKAALVGVNQRMRELTNGRIGYRFGSWATAPARPRSRFTCDIFDVDASYRRYARSSTQPTRATDEITVFVSPFQTAAESDCGYLGVAVLGGNVVHLNGLQYTADGVARSRHLERWVLAHELGHNLGLRHSDLRWPGAGVVPTSPLADRVQPYGDHLDLMGGATEQYYEPRADWANWFLSANSSALLGVLRPGSADLPLIRRSGTYTVNALYSSMTDRRAQGLLFAGPPDSDTESGAWWVLEYRSGVTPVDASGGLAAVFFPRTHGVRLYATQHVVNHNGTYYPVGNYQLVSGPSASQLRRNVPVGASQRLQGTSRGRTVTVTVLSQDRTSARVRVRIGSGTQVVAWPSTRRFRALRKGKRLALPARTDQSRAVTWTRTRGKACAVARRSGRSWLVKRANAGSCTVRAAASGSTAAGVARYRRTVTYRAR